MLYFSDPSREPRECLRCSTESNCCPTCGALGFHCDCTQTPCEFCNGSGRIAGKPDVETHFGTGNGGWNWRPFPLDRTHWRGPFDTEGDALTAAHAALTETTE